MKQMVNGVPDAINEQEPNEASEFIPQHRHVKKKNKRRKYYTFTGKTFETRIKNRCNSLKLAVTFLTVKVLAFPPPVLSPVLLTGSVLLSSSDRSALVGAEGEWTACASW
ncbi:hypothetical protein E2C01_027338 [Portunus trituberculatus]|uniref:Uncharacterized protein n=1 Tax=Portunus trituberculatus TaxID=210409 RepID=A0A5B7EKW0_PORTR|nr:hypothetical protein [Portunus trituberculatus]